MLKGAIFDIDGTLLDSVEAQAEAWSAAFREHGYQVTGAQVRRQIGKTGGDPVPVFLDADACARDGQALAETQARIFRADHMADLKPFPQVRDLFQALRDRKVKIALASAQEGDALQQYTALMQIDDLIDTAASSGEHATPAPDMFQAAMDRLMPLDHEHTLAFVDSPADATGAARLGLRSVGLRCGGFTDAELENAGIIRIYNDPADLLNQLEEVLLLV